VLGGDRGAKRRVASGGGVAKTQVIRRILPQELAKSKARPKALSKVKPRRASRQRDDVVVNKTGHQSLLGLCATLISKPGATRTVTADDNCDQYS
jgi:hypothetical protein